MQTHTPHLPANQSRNRRLPLLAAIAALLTSLWPSTAPAQMAVHPALDPSVTPSMTRMALGDWGESVVEHAFKARGFETLDPKVGPHGLDRVVFTRDGAGRLADVRAIEVKARTAAGDLGLPGDSRNGVQLTNEKIASDLGKAASNHPDPKVRALLTEIEEFKRANPSGIKAERHVLTVKDGRYTVYEGPSTARPVGRPAFDGSLDKLLGRLGESPNRQTAAAARLNRAYLQTQRAATTVASDTVGSASASMVGGAARSVRPLPSVGPYATAFSGAMAAGLVTSGLIAGMATYDWYRGEISDARLHEELLHAGGTGIAVTVATGAILMLTPAAPGVVLIAVTTAVAIAADMAFEWAMERENEHLVEREHMIRYGFVPDPADADRSKPWPTPPNPLREYLEGGAWPDDPVHEAAGPARLSSAARSLSTSSW
jgi:hypothetical protein